jgi:hypothetical protein
VDNVADARRPLLQLVAAPNVADRAALRVVGFPTVHLLRGALDALHGRQLLLPCQETVMLEMLIGKLLPRLACPLVGEARRGMR